MSKYVTLDEDGYFGNGTLRYEDDNFGAELLRNLKYKDRVLVSKSGENDVIVEAFSDPLVARHVFKSESGVGYDLEFPYGIETLLDLNQLYVDEWDRFHGFTQLASGETLPFVLSRQAQADLFELAEEFDDDSITLDGKAFDVKPWYMSESAVDNPLFWGAQYSIWKDDASKPGWDLEEPAAALRDISSQLKLNKARIAVLGSGSGHDAAFFAQQGHHVTGIDFSADAIKVATEKYGNVKNLQFLQGDVFKLPEKLKGSFDIVYDHTLLCAINPTQRREALKAYKRLLAPEGHLLGIFMILNPSVRPPFGMTEWELREMLKGKFHTLYWTRWKKSIPRRDGRELIVYAQAKELN